MLTKRENIWNLPNLLTLLRLALIGVFIALFASGLRLWALGTFLLAALTDFLDGRIARKYHLITDFGKLMDPLADKLMLLTALTCLTIAGDLPVWIVIVVAAKELFMIAGGMYMLRRGIVVHAHFIGKAATAAFLLAVTVSFLHAYTAPWDLVLQCVAVALTLAAMVHYICTSCRMLRVQAERPKK